MNHVSRFASPTTHTLCLDADWGLIAQEPDEAPESPVTSDNLAYVIYTSGSTGRPKGTMLHHRGLCNLVYALGPTFEINTESRLLQFASFSFDASVAEIFPALICGATLCMAPRETIASSHDLSQLMQQEEVDIATIVPSVLTLLPAKDSLPLETLVAAGERCSKGIVDRWAPRCRFFNCYGPTETTVAATCYLVENPSEETPNIPIGYPIYNTKVHLLDKNLQAVPIGVPGEMHIGGVSLARGYLDRPGLTAAKFIPDPYADEPGARLYKTGDLARYRADGAIEFLGRIDHQVKVRGFRIELGEVEAVLSQHPGVQQTVALAREDTPGDKRLVAYVVPSDEQDPASLIRELREAVDEKLPDYMHPSAFVTLDTLPLTPNKKVDRKALPAPDGTRQEMETPLVGPRDALELELARMWEKILGVEPVGVEDDFFTLGGHSLLAIRLIAQIEKRFGISLPMVELFQQPTVAHLTSVLRRMEGGVTTDTLVPIQPEGSKRPLFFVHPSGGSVHWYADLGRHLRPDQPFYGIQARGLNGNHKLHTSIEDMAAHYVAAIRDFQPEGPYLLGSWSMGVAVAFEMAQQFHAQGQEVAFLGMLDQGPYLPAEEPEDDAAYLVDVFGGHLSLSLDHLRTLDGDEQIAHVWEEARRVNWIYPEVTLDQFRHFVHILRTHTEAWRSYEPQEYPGQITLFRARKQDEDRTQEPDMGWGELALGGVEIHQVPGDHLSMMHRPRARVLARKLKARLQESQAEG
jgi:amino acid adenylation domain-containing protein